MSNKKKKVNDFERSSLKYFTEISKYKPLSRNEEMSLWEKYKKNNDIKARDKLIKSNLKFVAMIAKTYQGLGLSYPDLIAEGNIGLLKAFDKFDHTKGFKTISYSVWWIKQTILEALKRRNILDGDEMPEFKSRDNGFFDGEEIISEDADFDDETNLKNEFLEKDCLESFVNKENKKIIEFLCKCLNEKEKFIIDRYFGLNDCEEMTLEAIGDELNLTKERVRQIKEKCLNKLRSTALEKNCFSDVY